MRFIFVFFTFYLWQFSVFAQDAIDLTGTQDVLQYIPQVIDAFRTGNWMLLITVGVIALTFLLKKFGNFLNIPDRYRLLLVGGLGLLGAGLGKIAGGMPWTEVFFVALSGPLSVFLHMLYKGTILGKDITIENTKKDLKLLEDKISSGIKKTEEAMTAHSLEIQKKIAQKVLLEGDAKNLEISLEKIKSMKNAIVSQAGNIEAIEKMIDERINQK